MLGNQRQVIIVMTSLSKTYTDLIGGYCRININNNIIQSIHLQKIILKDYKTSNKSRRIICGHKLYSLYMDKKYRITKYFTVSRFNNYLSFKLIINNAIRLFIKVYPSLSRYEGYYQSGKFATQRFKCKFNLLQLTQNYKTNTTTIRGKAMLEGNSDGTMHLLQIHFYSKELVHLGHLSIQLKGKDINHGALHLEWEELIIMRNNVGDSYQGGFLNIDTDPSQLIKDEHLSNWKTW